jgi:RNA polymerase sigma-70 factor, ECF subfamily
MMSAESSPHPDLELRDQALKGDRAAAETLFERHLEALYEFVFYRVGRDVGLAESIVQDTMLTAFQSLAGYEGRSAFHTWLCGIAKNKIRTQRRKKRPVALDDLLNQSDPEIDIILLGIETEDIPDRVLEKRETRELVGAALSSLPPDYRRALVSKYVDELPVAEIAKREGRGEKAMESMLTRARVAFARVVELLAKKRGGM